MPGGGPVGRSRVMSFLRLRATLTRALRLPKPQEIWRCGGGASSLIIIYYYYSLFARAFEHFFGSPRHRRIHRLLSVFNPQKLRATVLSLTPPEGVKECTVALSGGVKESTVCS
jgi:hypothetical protein